MASKQFAKTRIAPTPSGFLHLGNILSFAVTAALAQKSGAKIFLRIDDLDQARVNNQYLQDIFDTLNFLEFPGHEGPQNSAEFEKRYSQLYRLQLYNDALQQLNDNNLVFACTCSRTHVNHCNCLAKKLPLTTLGASWRFITNDKTEIFVKNYNGENIKTILPAAMKNFVVKKKDGLPAYQLTSIIDDIYYGIDLIVRGDDLWPSTLVQHQLASALGLAEFKEITFFHHPLLMAANGGKLSKSAGATSVKYLRESGITAAGIYKNIALMLGIDKTVYSHEQLGNILLR